MTKSNNKVKIFKNSQDFLDFLKVCQLFKNYKYFVMSFDLIINYH